MKEQEKYYIEDDEITLKELILKLKEFWGYLWERKVWIILVGILMAAFFAIRAKMKPVEYKASLTFMVEDDTGIGGVGGILSQFGFSTGGEYNLKKILTLSKSMQIVKKVVLDSGIVNGTNDMYGNQIIEAYAFHEKPYWNKPENELQDFLFGDESRSEKAKSRALKFVYEKLVGKNKGADPLYSSSIVEDSGIMTLSVKSESGDLSLGLVKSFFKHLGEYYISKSTEKAESTFTILQDKTDSIYSELGKKEYALALFRDKNRGLILNQSRLREQKLQTEIAALRGAWGESIKNQEYANYALSEQTPFIQSIDVPFAPIEPIPNSLIKALILGAFLGAFLSVLFFVLQKIIRQAME